MNKKEACLLLKLNDDFNEESLKKAYKKEMKNVHPDINPNLTNATQLAQKINEAYDILKKSLKENNVKEDVFDFINYKHSTLAKIDHILDKIQIDNTYNNDYFFEIYKKYIVKELVLYKELYENVKLRSQNEKDILLFESTHQYKIDKLFENFMYYAFEMFVKRCNNFSNVDWLKEKCNYYINNNNFHPTTINDCMKYYLNVKKSITKRVIDKQISFYASKLSWKNKKYLKNDSQLKIIDSLFLKYTEEEILSNEKNIKREFKSYINKRRLEYIKFYIEKEYKIINLKFFALKNDIKLDKKQFKRLKLERREDKFNEKYLLLEKDINDLLGYKTSSKHR